MSHKAPSTQGGEGTGAGRISAVEGRFASCVGSLLRKQDPPRLVAVWGAVSRSAGPCPASAGGAELTEAENSGEGDEEAGGAKESCPVPTTSASHSERTVLKHSDLVWEMGVSFPVGFITRFFPWSCGVFYLTCPRRAAEQGGRGALRMRGVGMWGHCQPWCSCPGNGSEPAQLGRSLGVVPARVRGVGGPSTTQDCDLLTAGFDGPLTLGPRCGCAVGDSRRAHA